MISFLKKILPILLISLLFAQIFQVAPLPLALPPSALAPPSSLALPPSLLPPSSLSLPPSLSSLPLSPSPLALPPSLSLSLPGIPFFFMTLPPLSLVLQFPIFLPQQSLSRFLGYSLSGSWSSFPFFSSKFSSYEVSFSLSLSKVSLGHVSSGSWFSTFLVIYLLKLRSSLSLSLSLSGMLFSYFLHLIHYLLFFLFFNFSLFLSFLFFIYYFLSFFNISFFIHDLSVLVFSYLSIYLSAWVGFLSYIYSGGLLSLSLSLSLLL
ncbi:unnamed protein product [Acanthosepion pharaonis]|uniref:Uncharacterized protein n=1 Tax=Acanthosepion pharaonis TaxID=158019 RepID=A0A812EAD1_ACAPH|nr:unnamed protein product [Sepia pharaonis]